MNLPFLGRWTCTIDGKRRLTLPAKIREILAAESQPHLITTVGHRGSLILVPLERWERMAPAFLNDTFQGDAGELRLRAEYALYGSLGKLDGSGRLTLTDEQIEFAGLEKQAVVFGNFTRIEIWSPERFAAENPPIGDTQDHDRLAAKHMGSAPKKEVRT